MRAKTVFPNASKITIRSSNNGFLRLKEIVAPYGPLPIGKSTWWEGVRTGRFPKPIKLGPRITVWRETDIITLIETGAIEANKN